MAEVGRHTGTQARFLDGGDADGSSKDDLGSAAGGDVAGFVRSGAATNGELAAISRSKILGGKTANAFAPPRSARSKANTTCPKLLEKGHTAQECPKPNVDVKGWRCFVRGEPGGPTQSADA